MKKFEDRIRQYLKERDWDELRPSDLAKSVIIEGAELLEIFQWDNQSPQEVSAEPEKIKLVKKELADVIIYCFEMAVILGFDVEKILNEKLDRAIEKYPKEIFNKKKRTGDPGTESQYWKVKKAYRKKDTK